MFLRQWREFVSWMNNTQVAQELVKTSAREEQPVSFTAVWDDCTNNFVIKHQYSSTPAMGEDSAY